VAITAIEYAIAIDEGRVTPSDNASQLSTDAFEPLDGGPAATVDDDPVAPAGDPTENTPSD
jgi:hypothetical protein